MSDGTQSASAVAELPLVQRLSAVLWPSFLLSGAATGVFFTIIDPVTMMDCQGTPPLSRTAAYSLGFFLFWLLTGGTSAVTLYFLSSQVPPPKRIDIPDTE